MLLLCWKSLLIALDTDKEFGYALCISNFLMFQKMSYLCLICLEYNFINVLKYLKYLKTSGKQQVDDGDNTEKYKLL